MKLLFGIAFSLLSFCAFSQRNAWDVREHLNIDKNLFSQLPPKAPSGIDINTYLQQLSKKDSSGLQILPQDNMPCIVPNTKDIAAIPNAWKGKVAVPFRSQMPNPAQPGMKADISTK